MLTTNDVAKVYDTILSIPGMGETVKIDLKISRKNVLLLSHVVNRGLERKGEDKNAGLLHSMTAQDLEEVRKLTEDCLQKAGLTELNDKLNLLENVK